MKGKTSLVLLEQVVMILVFALAAALCLQAFALSGRISTESELRDRAVLQAQNAVEILKDCGGDRAQAVDQIGGRFDGDILVCEADGLRMTVVWQTPEVRYLGTAQVTVRNADGDVLAELPAAWQEVDENG